MEDAKATHRDCRNYAPIDAAKGLCRHSKSLTQADDKICERFSRLPRCRWCGNYRPDPAKVQVGTCAASANGFLAYADMTAKTCSQFQALG